MEEVVTILKRIALTGAVLVILAWIGTGIYLWTGV